MEGRMFTEKELNDFVRRVAISYAISKRGGNMKAFKDEDIIKYFVFVLRKICDKGYRVTDYDIYDMSFNVITDTDITLKSMIRNMIPESWIYNKENIHGTKTLTVFKMRDAIGVDDISAYKHKCISSLENYVDNYLLNYC